MSPTTPPKRWTLSAALAVALVASAIALGAAAGLAAVDADVAPAVVPVDGTTAYLQPGGDGSAREAVGSVSVDASVAVTGSAQRLHGRFERQTFEARYGAADSEAERATLFRRHVRELDSRIEAIEDAHYDAIESHSSGRQSTDQFLRTIAYTDTAAQRATSFKRLLENRSILAGSGPSKTTLRNLEVELATIRSPALSQVRDRFTNGPDDGGVYVKTVGSDGLVVATVDNDEYRRAALDGSERNVGGENQFTNRSEVGIGVAYERATQLYPWIFRENVAPGPATRYGNTSVYSIVVDHSQGQLSTYLDGATENVFREVQRKRLSVLPEHQVGSETAGDLRVVATGTHETGPLRVRVERPGSGEPVDTTIRIDGSRVGTTGSDGQLWTIQPDSGFTINATRGETSVTLSIG